MKRNLYHVDEYRNIEKVYKNSSGDLVTKSGKIVNGLVTTNPEEFIKKLKKQDYYYQLFLSAQEENY